MSLEAKIGFQLIGFFLLLLVAVLMYSDFDKSRHWIKTTATIISFDTRYSTYGRSGRFIRVPTVKYTDKNNNEIVREISDRFLVESFFMNIGENIEIYYPPSIDYRGKSYNDYIVYAGKLKFIFPAIMSFFALSLIFLGRKY